MAMAMNLTSISTIQKHIAGLKKAGAVSRDKDYGGVWIIHYSR